MRPVKIFAFVAAILVAALAAYAYFATSLDAASLREALLGGEPDVASRATATPVGDR